MKKRHLTILTATILTVFCMAGCSSTFEPPAPDDVSEDVTASASKDESTAESSAMLTDLSAEATSGISTDIVALAEEANTAESVEEKKPSKTMWVVVKETEYDPAGSVDRTAEYEYDEYGKETLEKNIWSNGEKLFLSTENIYDDDGRHIEEHVSDSDTGELRYTCEYKYNDKGTCVGCIRTYPNGQMFSMYASNGVEYNVSSLESNNLWSDDRHTLTVYFGNTAISYTFDDDGNLTELYSMDGTNVKYDKHGNRTYEKNGNGEEFMCLNEYDEYGNRLKETCSDGWYTEYEYKKIELK